MFATLRYNPTTSLVERTETTTGTPHLACSNCRAKKVCRLLASQAKYHKLNRKDWLIYMVYSSNAPVKRTAAVDAFPKISSVNIPILVPVMEKARTVLKLRQEW